MAVVIKIEPLTGDISRHVQPALIGVGHLGFNRNKRSIALNLKDNTHYARFMGLLDGADVLVHNMRPPAAKRLRLDPKTVRQAHPKLVYCVSTGYGSRGRSADLPAYDDIIQAASGVARLNRDDAGEPNYLPTILCDRVGGLHFSWRCWLASYSR